MSKFINPFTDWGFKKIFGQEISKDLLIEFLNDLLVGERVITDLTFMNTEQARDYQEARGAIYDIYCTTDTGEKIIVEMQNRSQSYFKERAIYYMSRAVVNQGELGNKWMFDVKAVYGVFLMNFLIDENTKLRTDVILADRETGDLFSDKFRAIFIALPQFKKTEEECETDFERWIFILNNMETLNRMPFRARKAVFEKLEDIANVAALSNKERAEYDQSVKVYRDYLVTMDAATNEGLREGLREGMEKGLQKGIEKGMQKGMQKGIEQGIEQGIQVGMEKGKQEGIKEGMRQSAINLKKQNIATTIISQCTGLTEAEIEEL